MAVLADHRTRAVGGQTIEKDPMSKLDLGQIGVSLNIAPDDAHLDEARQLERLGYRTLWLSGGQLDRLARITQVIQATAAIQVGSGIISPDVYRSDEVASLYADRQGGTPDRFVVGLGGSQQPPSLPGLLHQPVAGRSSPRESLQARG